MALRVRSLPLASTSFPTTRQVVESGTAQTFCVQGALVVAGAGPAHTFYQPGAQDIAGGGSAREIQHKGAQVAAVASGLSLCINGVAMLMEEWPSRMDGTPRGRPNLAPLSAFHYSGLPPAATDRLHHVMTQLQHARDLCCQLACFPSGHLATG